MIPLFLCTHVFYAFRLSGFTFRKNESVLHTFLRAIVRDLARTTAGKVSRIESFLKRALTGKHCYS